MCLYLMAVCGVYRDLVKRLFRGKVGEKQRVQTDNFTDPLEEIYFQTLVRGERDLIVVGVC